MVAHHASPMTTLSGAPPLNVIASTAKAGVNIQIIVGDTVAGVLEHLRKTHRRRPGGGRPSLEEQRAVPDLADGRRRVRADRGHDHRRLPRRRARAVHHDGRHRLRASSRRSPPRVYQFAPFRMTKAQRQAIHSCDEHLGVNAVLEGVRWYHPPDREAPRVSDAVRRPGSDEPARDRRLPGLRGAGQRRPAGLLHADLQRHRRPPRHQGRRRQLVRGGPADPPRTSLTSRPRGCRGARRLSG